MPSRQEVGKRTKRQIPCYKLKQSYASQKPPLVSLKGCPEYLSLCLGTLIFFFLSCHVKAMKVKVTM